MAFAITGLARRIPAARPVELRMALSAIHRPGNLTPSVVLSLGLGLAALVALSLIDFNMRSQLMETLPGVTPSFFFLDLRSAEATGFVDFLKREAPGVKISETPMMRGRFVRIAGTLAADVRASDKAAWALEGDRGVTFARACRKAPRSSAAHGGRPIMLGRRSSRWRRMSPRASASSSATPSPSTCSGATSRRRWRISAR